MDGPPPPPPASVFTLKKPLKITKVVRPAVPAEPVAPAVPELTPEEEEQRFAEQFGGTRSSIRKLEATSSLEAVLELASSIVAGSGGSSKVCAAFDFDQTLHLRESQRGRAGELLLRLRALNVPVCIVTAAQPRSGSVKALAQEMHELHLDEFFRTTKLNPSHALDVVRHDWPDNESLSPEQLQNKLLVLLSLFTDRRPADLSRVGYSGISFKENNTACYRMQRGRAEWSAELVLTGDPDHRVCPVRCLKAHLARILPVRAPPVYREIDPELDMPEDIVPGDRLFLTSEGLPLEPKDIEKLVGDFLIHRCKYPDWQVIMCCGEKKNYG